MISPKMKGSTYLLNDHVLVVSQHECYAEVLYTSAHYVFVLLYALENGYHIFKCNRGPDSVGISVTIL